MSHKTVLIIDDDRDMRQAIARMFARQGWSVCTAGDGCDGRTQLDTMSPAEPDFIVCEVEMVGGGGSEFAAFVHGQYPHLCSLLFFHTARGSSRTQHAALRALGRDVLVKPGSLAVLTRVASRDSTLA